MLNKCWVVPLSLMLWCLSLPLAQAADRTILDAPDFRLGSVAGPNYRLLEQRGEVVVLNFWATWCGNCRKAMPQFERLHQQYGQKDLQIFGVNLDTNDADLNGFLKDTQLSFPILRDTEQKVSQLYNVEAMPTTVIIDRDGRIQKVYEEMENDTLQNIETDIRQYLNQW